VLTDLFVYQIGCLVNGPGFFVGTVTGQGIEDIGEGDNAG
jgi:hypothetical protein